MIDLLLTTLLISLWCVGLFQITRRGAVFGIAERFFDWVSSEEEKAMNRCRAMSCDGHYARHLPIHKRHLAFASLRFLLTPLIGCCKCMASVWGVAVYWVLYGITWEGMPYLVLACISASGVNALLLRLVEGRP